MQVVTGTRDRILTATNELFRRHGYHGTSLKQVTTLAAAPTGSLYHFFPGGKDDLTLAVITTSGETYRQLFELIADAAPDPAHAVSDFFEAAARMLEETDYIDPCPIGTIAREVANSNDTLREGTDQVFRGWIDTAAARFERHGLQHDHAERLAITIVAALEGGFVLARARRDAELLRVVGHSMRHLADEAMHTVPAN